MLNPLPWHDGEINRASKVWDADDQEVDLSRYTALLVAVVNEYLPTQARRRGGQ